MIENQIKIGSLVINHWLLLILVCGMHPVILLHLMPSLLVEYVSRLLGRGIILLTWLLTIEIRTVLFANSLIVIYVLYRVLLLQLVVRQGARPKFGL